MRDGGQFAIYSRKSKFTGKGESIENQIEMCRQYIRMQFGDAVADGALTYEDEGLTGTRMDQREDFNRMLSDCRKGKVNNVLVKSISRFSHNAKDCLATLRELTALAQQESISIAENQRISYQRRMERGEFITCKAPFGYRIRDGKHLEVAPEEAEQVRWIFDCYLSGRSLA